MKKPPRPLFRPLFILRPRLNSNRYPADNCLVKVRIPLAEVSGDDFFKKFFGDGNGNMQMPDQRASGSGVIISSDGYIVTNNHVVNGATEITVTMNNRKNYTAKVIGTDPNTDLALIKIDAKIYPLFQLATLMM